MLVYISPVKNIINYEQYIPQLSIKFYEHNVNKTIPKAIVEEWEIVK